jgi:transcriptional regulator with XRE-family HTH domain
VFAVGGRGRISRNTTRRPGTGYGDLTGCRTLRRARTERRRTLRDVSRRARVSLGYLSEVERGRKEPSSELLAAICEALDVPLPDLLTEAAETIAESLAASARSHRPMVGLRHMDLRIAAAGDPLATVPL